MKKKQKNIPLIHNYCDRWCERCYFTSRCAVALSTGKLSAEQQDINNKAFWDHLSVNFAQTITLLHQSAEKFGFTIPGLTEEEHKAYLEEEELERKQIKAHSLIKQSNAYINLAKKWLDKNEQLNEKQDEIILHFEIGIRSEKESISELATIEDCFGVIQWYLYFISVKFMRALSSKMEEDKYKEENSYPKDSNGSAKIALISTERTMQAWLQLNELLPGMEDDALPILASLQKLQSLAYDEFPDAMKFIRPGFDEM